MPTSQQSNAHLTINGEPIPTLDEIAAQHFALTPWVTRTPVFERTGLPALDNTHVNFKFELLQASGSFKARGAFTNLLALDESRRSVGVTCVSAGNHAAAVAYAAIEAEEGRFFVHPFSGYHTILGTATLGYEWATQTPDLDAVILPIGGGGLAAGVSTALRLANPRVHVYGVEPEGADVMSRSFAANHTVKIGPMRTIADSLTAPHTEEYSYELCRRHIDRLVTVSDDALRAAMLFLFTYLKVAVEPACAAATAALLGPLRETLQGKRVGVLLSGTNTDPVTLATHLEHARLQR